ncbi:MAG TPA: histidinol dehydrogenase, partial [Ktedonobacteraceae bacterium]
MIHFYELSTMNASQRLRLLRRAELQIDELTERVRPIIQAVRERGDEALVEFTTRFDHVQLSPDRLRIGHDEIEQAHRLLDPSVREAIEH